MNKRLRGRVCWKDSGGRTWEGAWTYNVQEIWPVISMNWAEQGQPNLWIEIQRIRSV